MADREGGGKEETKIGRRKKYDRGRVKVNRQAEYKRKGRAGITASSSKQIICTYNRGQIAARILDI